VPQNLPSSEAGAGHGPAFLEWLTPEMIGRVTVIKGPVSALFGDQNRAGAVDIRTRTGPVENSASLTLETYGGRRGNLVLSNALGPVQSLLVADIYRSDSYRDRSWLQRDNLMWKLSMPLEDGLYSLRLNHYRSDFRAPGYLRYDRLVAGLVAPTAVEEGALPGFGGGKRTALVFNRAPLQGEAGWHTTAYVEDFERVRAATAGGVTHNRGSDDRVVAGGRLAYNWQPSERVGLVAGADLRKDKGEGIRQRYVNEAPTPNYLTNLHMDLLTWGLFAQGQYRPVDAFKLTAGARWDHFDYEIQNRRLPAASTHYRDSVFTPKLGAVWSLMPQLDVFANAAEGFRSPAAQQISPGGTLGPLGAAGGTVNGHIGATKVRSYDLGFAAAPWSSLSVTAAGYHTVNQDEIVLVAPDTFRSVGDTTRQGYEVEARWNAGAALSAYASYNRILRARVNNPTPGTAPELSVPRHQLKAGVQYSLRAGAGTLRLNADAYYTAGNPYYSGTPLVRREMPVYTRYDLKATYDIEKVQVSAYLVLQPQRFSSEAAFATTAGLWVSPMPKRQAGVTVRYFF
jgi:outer membrane receptor protein involved in Fe transport